MLSWGQAGSPQLLGTREQRQGIEHWFPPQRGPVSGISRTSGLVVWADFCGAMSTGWRPAGDPGPGTKETQPVREGTSTPRWGFWGFFPHARTEPCCRVGSTVPRRRRRPNRRLRIQKSSGLRFRGSSSQCFPGAEMNWAAAPGAHSGDLKHPRAVFTWPRMWPQTFETRNPGLLVPG